MKVGPADQRFIQRGSEGFKKPVKTQNYASKVPQASNFVVVAFILKSVISHDSLSYISDRQSHLCVNFDGQHL
jgi:hypothetical protein